MNETKESYHRILRSTSIIGGASFINIVVAVVRTKVLAVMLGPSGMGLASLYTGLINTASSVATSGLGPVGTRQIAVASATNDLHAHTVARRALLLGTLVLAVAGALIVWTLRSQLAVYALGDASYAGAVGWLSLGVALSIAGASQGALIQGMRRVGDIARLSVFGSGFNTILGIALLWRWGKDGLVAFVLIGPAISFMLGHYYVSKLPKSTPQTITLSELAEEWSVLIRLGTSMVGAGLVGSMAQLWIRIDIAKVLGAQPLGQYQAAWTVSMQYVTFILAAMGTDYYPRLTRVIHNREAASQLVNEQTEIATLLSAPIFIGMMAMAPWVIHLLYAASFGPAVEILRWQVLGDVLKVASWPLGFIILAAGDGKTFFCTEALSWGVVAALIVGLTPIFGLRITGIAYTVMYIVYLPLVYVLASRRIGFRFRSSVLSLLGATFFLCIGIGLLSSLWHWGKILGTATALAFGIFSLGRITQMSNAGGGCRAYRRVGAAVRMAER